MGSISRTYVFAIITLTLRLAFIIFRITALSALSLCP